MRGGHARDYRSDRGGMCLDFDTGQSIPQKSTIIWVSALFKNPPDPWQTPVGSGLLSIPIHSTQVSSVMASTAIDVEQSSLNQRPVVAQTSSGFESEKAGFDDGQSFSEETPEKVWQPEDA